MPKHKPVPQHNLCDIGALRSQKEFAIEGDLKIVHMPSPSFIVDDCHLAELVRFHFQPQNSREGFRLGRVQIIIVPILE